MPEKPVLSVSIVSANYNNGPYLRSFIESVAASTCLPKELILVDDGSTDDSVNIIRAYNKLFFLKSILFEQNKGFTVALNAGLEAASGKYIMRADPDDLFLPARIETQYNHMESHPEIDVLGSNVIYFNDKDGSKLNTSNFPLKHQEITARYIKGEHGLQHPTVFIKGSVYKNYRYQKIFPAEDYEIFSRMVKDGRIFANLPEPLYMMRVHTGSSTSNLRFKDIQQTFAFRDKIFNAKTSRLRIWCYFQHISYYRRSQLARTVFAKYLHLLVSILFYPKKLFRRIF